MATAPNASFTLSCPHNGTAHDGTLLCHWTNSPGARGTLNIFWLCLSTLGLCVWNAVHPDVPRPNTPWWRVFGKRVWWLFVGLFMPEMLVLVALGQFRQAWKLLVRINEDNRCPTEFPWWMYLVKSWRPKNGNPDSPAKRWIVVKALLRWMEPLLRRLRVPSRSDLEVEKGQSVLAGERDPLAAAAGADDAPVNDSSKSPDTSQQAHSSSTPAVSDPATSDCAREHPWTLTHSFYAVMQGFVEEKGHAFANVNRRVTYTILLRRIALPLGDRKRIPDQSIDDIEDRSKAGVLAKSLLVWQLFVFLANCFARWNQSLPLSLLEITTISHSLCSIIAMVLWWYKPHSISEATVIAREGPLRSLSSVEWRKVFSWTSLKDSFRAGGTKVMGGGDMDVSKTLIVIAIAVLYGLPHLLGLSVHFPTVAEQLCWTVATSVVIGSPLAMCAILWMLALNKGLDSMESAVDSFLFMFFIILLILYPIASMFLVGESVRQIFALPIESFREPQLATYLPSFS